MPFHPENLTESTLKGFVDRVHRFVKTSPSPTLPPKRAWAQEVVAQALGFPSFHAAKIAIKNGKPTEESKTKNDPDPLHWQIKTPSGFYNFSRDILSISREGMESTIINIPIKMLSSHLLLVGKEADRLTAFNSLLHIPSMPILWIQGSSAAEVKSDPGIVIDIHTSEKSGRLTTLDPETVLSNRTLLRIEGDHPLFQVSIDRWLKAFSNGVIVVDGLNQNSHIYEWLINSMAKIEEKQHKVVVGVRGLNDLPPSPILQRILDRLGLWAVIKGTPSGRNDAFRLCDLNA